MITRSRGGIVKSLLLPCHLHLQRLGNQGQQQRRISSNKGQEKDADLTWNGYFELRKKRRLHERLFAIPTTLTGLVVGGSYFALKQIDPTATFMGIDPLFAYAGGTLAAGMLGYLAGPVVGSWTWKLQHRKWATSMEQKDRAFYDHLSKNRSDASLHSIRNPVPDYYGEKINSLHSYRAWLRKQREHKRKAAFHLGDE